MFNLQYNTVDLALFQALAYVHCGHPSSVLVAVSEGSGKKTLSKMKIHLVVVIWTGS